MAGATACNTDHNHRLIRVIVAIGSKPTHRKQEATEVYLLYSNSMTWRQQPIQGELSRKAKLES